MDTGQVEEDFSFLKDEEGVLGIVVFGSQVTGRAHERSDIDVCVVAPDRDPQELWLRIDREIRPLDEAYDFHVFEDFTPRLKHRVVQDHEVVWTRDRPELEYYFYKQEEIWRDQAKARGVA